MTIYGHIFTLKNRLKWAWQRAYRGYDDTAKWGLYYSIAEISSPCIKAMIDNGTGHPYGETEKSWRKKLLLMKKSFDLILLDNDDIDEEYLPDMPDSMAWDSPEGIEEWDRRFPPEKRKEYWKAQERRQKEIRKGLQLFATHFQSLWD